MNNSRLLLAALAAAALGVISPLRAEVDEALAKKLFAAGGTREEFKKVTKEAKKAGAPAQLLAEAKLVWGLRNKDTEYLAQCLPELEKVAKIFKAEESAGLGSAEDFKALISYVKALDALGKGDEAALKEHITEAFWLSPEQAGLFADTITYFRTQAKMAKITVDLNLPITNSKAEDTTLGDMLGKNKALLLDFWASWCGPCMNLMPELREKAEHLGRYGVVVAGMNTESDSGIADKVRSDKGMEDVAWLVEPKERPFSQLLGIDSIPRMVLVSPEGKVLFNGHPMDPALWAALKKVDPKLEPMTSKKEE